MSNLSICPELNGLKEVRLEDHPVCIECIKTGDRWVHLRTCQTCGETRCCDDSKNKHATKHYHLSGHPVVASAEPGERWVWCFKHEQFAEW
jgi:hypothetical protein